MTDIIHLLPDSVANQIAAGEVIQRPASCLKELVENSLDAGATNIRILVRDAGRTLLQVIDNGCGMSNTDARMAFERHATSKISQAADLFHLHTMGFRGEALASICAVAQVEVLTRRAGDEIGTRLEIAGSEVQKQEPVQCSVGTNIRVKNLFYNVPARRKFLKTDQTELRNLLTEYHRIVLVNPEVQFTFVSNDEIISELPAATTKQRIEGVFGHSSKPFTGQLVDVSTNTELVNICGFVGKPESAGKNSQQYMFVNGRFMRHPYFHKAVMTAYSGMLAADHTPSYFLYFSINPEAIDINIHPTKTEIKFADEQAIFQILLAAVRESLGKFNVAPSLDFTTESHLDMPQGVLSGKSVTIPHIQVDPSYNPFKRQAPSSNAPRNWDALYAQTRKGVGDQSVPEIVREHTQLFDFQQIEETTPLLQWASKYIIAPTDMGLLVAHQHRLHVAVLYKELQAQLQAHNGITQPLLFPELLELSLDDTATVQSMLPDLQSVGFALEQFSPYAYNITAVPALLGQKNAGEVLLQVVHNVQDTGGSASSDWHRSIAIALAEQMAIPVGKSLTDAEMRDLLSRFMLAPSKYLPNGQTILTIFTDEDFRKYF